MPRVEIRMTGPGRGTVSIDGHPMPFVTRIEFTAKPDSVNVVTLQIAAGDVVILQDAQVVDLDKDAP